MANYRKAFNFSSGVQVDNDNFVVSPVGLVGIGTSVPTAGYKLDVHGNIKSTGLTTTQDLNVSRNVEVSGITTVGFITASSMGITTDLTVGGTITANKLSLENGLALDNVIGYAFTAFITDNAGIGLHTTSKIGLNTTTSPGASDSALEVFGDVNVTGVITATTFSGALSGALSGDVTGNVNASSGVSTFTELKVGAAITMSTGIVTATKFIGNLTGDVTGGSVNATSGISTFTELKVGTAITMSAGIVTATSFDGALDSANLTQTIDDARLPNLITSNINILSGTSYFSKIGVNTTTPLSDIHLRTNAQTALQVTSNSNASLIGLGRSENITGYNGVLRYGNTDGAFSQFSGVGVTSYSLDVMNYGPGNINFYLNPSEIAGTTGGFFWHKENQRLMALTSAGNLGVGLTDPSYKLHVSGTAYISGNVEFASNLNLTNNLILGSSGNIGINSSSPTEKLDVVGNIAATGNIVSVSNITANSISTTTGTSSQFLKADGSIDSSTYLTSALQNVGDDTNPQLGGNLDVNNNNIIGTGNINITGFTSCSNGFRSGDGEPVRITVVGSTLTFNVVGVGSTSLTLS